MNDNEKKLRDEQQERLTVKKGEVQFLTKEEIERRIKNKYKTYEEDKK